MTDASSRRRPRVWVLSELYFPEQTSTGHVVTELAEGLADTHDIHVLCGQPTYSARGVRAAPKEHRHGVSITRCSGTTFAKDRLILRVVNMITLSMSMWFHAVRAFRAGDVVMVLTTPPLLPFLGAFAAALRGSACVLIVHDVYPDAAYAAGLLRRNSLVARLIEFAHRRLYQFADSICVCGRDMGELILAKLGGYGDPRVVVIPNWADDVVPADARSNPLLAELNLTDKFVLLHIGNIGRLQAIGALFQAACELNASDPTIHFLFVGDGAQKPWLEAASARHGLSNVSVVGSRPRSDQQVFLNAGHVMVFGFVPGMYGVGVPSRMYNAMAVGRPLIAIVDEGSEPARVIAEEQIGWTVPSDRSSEVLAAIREAREGGPRLAEMGKRARQAVERRYLRDHIVAAYRVLIDAIDASRRP